MPAPLKELPRIRPSIVGGGCAKGCIPWVIRDIEIIDNIDYVKLTRRDSGFCRYVLGRNSGRNGLQDFKYLETLRMLRTSASERAITSDDMPLDALAAAGVPSPARSGQRRLSDMWGKREDRAKARVVGADIKAVEVELEEINFEGVVVGPLSIQMPFSLHYAQNVAVPLRADVLHYIRVAILAAGECGHTSRKQASSDANAPKHSKWIDQRSAFIAKRPGERAYRTFKLSKIDVDASPLQRSIAMDKARETCAAWLANGDEESQ